MSDPSSSSTPSVKDSRPTLPSRSPSLSLPSASSSSILVDQKARHVEAATTGSSLVRAGISMPPPTIRSTQNHRPTASQHRSEDVPDTDTIRGSMGLDDGYSVGRNATSTSNPMLADYASIEAAGFMETAPSNSYHRPQNVAIPQAGSRSNRLSTSSLYSLSSIVHSGAGSVVPSSAASAVSELIGGNNAIHPTPSTDSFSIANSVLPDSASTATTATSPVSIMTSSNAGFTSSNNHELKPRDQPGLPAAQSLQASHAGLTGPAVPAQITSPAGRGMSLSRTQAPARSRSRTNNRRISGGATAGSHSPSSEHGLHDVKEGKEGGSA